MYPLSVNSDFPNIAVDFQGLHKSTSTIYSLFISCYNSKTLNHYKRVELQLYIRLMPFVVNKVLLI